MPRNWKECPATRHVSDRVRTGIHIPDSQPGSLSSPGREGTVLWEDLRSRKCSRPGAGVKGWLVAWREEQPRQRPRFRAEA